MLASIEAKKRGQALSESQIRDWIEGVVSERVPLYQSAALLMAIRLKGMSFEETWWLTDAMAKSGDQLHFDQHPVVIDKHSTGGVGDKVTLILAPLVAACDVPVAMLSGRSLGFTGGTIDKFESLSGVNCEFDNQTLYRMMAEVGWVNAQPSSLIAPADKALYALRDVTGTVDSIPLITASIMSKKISGGASHLCLDVKCGSSAFMTRLEDATSLAETLIRVGQLGGLQMGGVISRMSEPLGRAVGNYLELWEAVSYLKDWPNTALSELVMDLARSMLGMFGVPQDLVDGRLRQALDSGEALRHLERYLAFCGAQDGALKSLMTEPLGFDQGLAVRAPCDGFVTAIAGHQLALFGVELGAGRKTKTDRIDPMAGFWLDVQVGDPIRKGDLLMRVFGAQSKAIVTEFGAQLLESFRISPEPKPIEPLVIRQLVATS